MSLGNKGLGRGLDSLFSGTDWEAGEERLMTLPIGQIHESRYQARTHWDENALSELTESIKKQGIIQPIVVRELGLDQYELIAGERRWRAAKLAGLPEIPAVIRVIDDKAAMAMGLIENIQRENLNPIEEAKGFSRLIEEFGLTHDNAAAAVGRSRSAISNSLRLLKLPEPVQKLLFDGELEMGHVRALINLPVQVQLDLAQKAAAEGWSVREIEQHSQAMLQEKAASQPPSPARVDAMRMADAMTAQLGVNVAIKTRDGKKGKLVLQFDSADDFQMLLKRLAIEIQE